MIYLVVAAQRYHKSWFFSLAVADTTTCRLFSHGPRANADCVAQSIAMVCSSTVVKQLADRMTLAKHQY